MKHAFWTPIWYLKITLAILGGIYVAVAKSVLFGFVYFVLAIISITIVANIFYAILRFVSPRTVAKWDSRGTYEIIFGSDPE